MQRTSSCNWTKGVLEMFAAQGVDVPRLVKAAGVDPARLENPAERFGADELSRLWDLAVAWSGNPVLGMDREITARHVNFDVVGYAMLSSPNLRAGLESLSRYMAVISDAAPFDLLPDGNNGWLVLGGEGYAMPVPRQRYAYGMLSILTLCQWLTRRDVQPLAVEFKFAQPPEVAHYRMAFGCPIRFGQPENRAATKSRRASRWRTGPCSGACMPKAPRSSSCSTTRGASLRASTCARSATRWARSRISWVSSTRATSSAPASDGSRSRRGSTAAGCRARSRTRPADDGAAQVAGRGAQGQ